MHDLILGFDLGTQSAKCVVMAPSGQVVAFTRFDYPILTPEPCAAEQNPEDWWQAFCHCTREVLQRDTISPSAIAAIGLSGQMHGVVLTADDGTPLYPAIIWADTRAGGCGQRLVEQIGEKRFAEITRNRAPAGFFGPNLLWLSENNPQCFRTARWFLSPKDWLRLKLTGHAHTEPSDASATALFDVAQRQWSHEIHDAAGINAENLPAVVESTAIAGHLTADAARASGLAEGTPVVAGAGDTPAAALGHGILQPGHTLLTIGTGGQLLCCAHEPLYDPLLRTHTFCHVLPQRWYVMAATLSAGLSLRWFRDVFAPSTPYDALMDEAAAVDPGASGILFMPHLAGERTPYYDPFSTAAFAGLSLRHTRAHLVRAILEGVAFSQRIGLELVRSLGLSAEPVVFGGGAAKSALWRQILADVLGIRLAVVEGEEHAALGAAMLAAVGVGIYGDLDDACSQLIHARTAASPSPTLAPIYDERYALFLSLYDRLRLLRSEPVASPKAKRNLA